MYICFYFCCVNLVETVLPSVCSEFSLSVFWNGIDFYIINVSLYRDVFFSMQNPHRKYTKIGTLRKWAGIVSAICRTQELKNNFETGPRCFSSFLYILCRPMGQTRGRIFKFYGIDSNESIPPDYAARRAGTIKLFLLGP
jgi:hypothetical protein